MAELRPGLLTCWLVATVGCTAATSDSVEGVALDPGVCQTSFDCPHGSGCLDGACVESTSQCLRDPVHGVADGADHAAERQAYFTALRDEARRLLGESGALASSLLAMYQEPPPQAPADPQADPGTDPFWIAISQRSRLREKAELGPRAREALATAERRAREIQRAQALVLDRLDRSFLHRDHLLEMLNSTLGYQGFPVERGIASQAPTPGSRSVDYETDVVPLVDHWRTDCRPPSRLMDIALVGSLDAEAVRFARDVTEAPILEIQVSGVWPFNNRTLGELVVDQNVSFADYWIAMRTALGQTVGNVQATDARVAAMTVADVRELAFIPAVRAAVLAQHPELSTVDAIVMGERYWSDYRPLQIAAGLAALIGMIPGFHAMLYVAAGLSALDAALAYRDYLRAQEGYQTGVEVPGLVAREAIEAARHQRNMSVGMAILIGAPLGASRIVGIVQRIAQARLAGQMAYADDLERALLAISNEGDRQKIAQLANAYGSPDRLAALLRAGNGSTLAPPPRGVSALFEQIGLPARTDPFRPAILEQVSVALQRNGIGRAGVLTPEAVPEMEAASVRLAGQRSEWMANEFFIRVGADHQIYFFHDGQYISDLEAYFVARTHVAFDPAAHAWRLVPEGLISSTFWRLVLARYGMTIL